MSFYCLQNGPLSFSPLIIISLVGGNSQISGDEDKKLLETVQASMGSQSRRRQLMRRGRRNQTFRNQDQGYFKNKFCGRMPWSSEEIVGLWRQSLWVLILAMTEVFFSVGFFFFFLLFHFLCHG